MSRNSPAVARMVAILNFLADHADRTFSLTELVRALQISRATCHALLIGLVEERYVFRAADKTYGLGSALVQIAEAAARNDNGLQVATREMRVLADELDVICALLMREGARAVVKDRAISRSHIGWNMPMIGTRMPVQPPLGGVFFAWSDEATIENWLASAPDGLDEDQCAELRQRLEHVRARGFAVDLRKVPIRDEEHARSLVAKIDESEYCVGAIEQDLSYPLASIEAPVLDEEGQVDFVIALMGFMGAVSGARILAIGTHLRAVCDRIATARR